jgi:hypothetical protein
MEALEEPLRLVASGFRDGGVSAADGAAGTPRCSFETDFVDQRRVQRCSSADLRGAFANRF